MEREGQMSASGLSWKLVRLGTAFGLRSGNVYCEWGPAHRSLTVCAQQSQGTEGYNKLACTNISIVFHVNKSDMRNSLHCKERNCQTNKSLLQVYVKYCFFIIYLRPPGSLSLWCVRVCAWIVCGACIHLSSFDKSPCINHSWQAKMKCQCLLTVQKLCVCVGGP